MFLHISEILAGPVSEPHGSYFHLSLLHNHANIIKNKKPKKWGDPTGSPHLAFNHIGLLCFVWR
jgi:hypothetical protein